MHIRIPKEKRMKLYPSGKKGIFVGYSESSKAYRIYFPRFKKIDIIRDVIFDEYSTYNKLEKGLFQNLKKHKYPGSKIQL